MLVGVASGAAVAGAGRVMRRRGSECSLGPAIAGGLLGGISQPLLDSIVHRDIRPLAPLSEANPLLGLVGAGLLKAACVMAGVVGAAILAVRWWRRTRTERRD